MQVVNAFSFVQNSLSFIITLLRAMAGIWPFGRGEITLGKGRILFVPQRPYLPEGGIFVIGDCNARAGSFRS